MKKKEWQEYYGLSDDEMNNIELLLKIFNGKIINVLDISVQI